MRLTALTVIGWGDFREWLSSWVALILSLLALVAFWPKLKNSVIGKLVAENRRVRGMIADMTIEEATKNVIIIDMKRQIETLELKLIEQHREQLDNVHISSGKNPKGSNR